MARPRIVARLTVLAIVLSACAGAQAASSEEAGNAGSVDPYATVRGEYVDAVSSFETCLDDKGFETDMVLEPNGVFYSMSYGSPGVDNQQEADKREFERDQAHDECYSEEFHIAIAELEALVAPSADEMRSLALECAAAFDAQVSLEDLASITESAPSDAEVALCLMARISDSIRIEFGVASDE